LGGHSFVAKSLKRIWKEEFPEDEIFCTTRLPSETDELLFDHGHSLIDPIISRIQPNLVVNLIGYVGDDKDIASHVNTELPREILRIQADVGFHAVLLGSAAEYGLRKNPEPLSETSELRPLGAYGASKAAQSELAEAAILAGADLTYVRAFNLVDLGMKSNLLPGRLENSVKEAMIDNSLAIRVNRADDVRDFLQLTDFCSILLNLVSLRSFSVFNVASGQGKSVGEFAEYFVHELLGQPDFTVEKLYTLAPTFSLADISKLKGALTDG